MVWPIVPPLLSLLKVLLLTRKARDSTSFGTPGLSSGNVAMTYAPAPLRWKISSSELSAKAG